MAPLRALCAAELVAVHHFTDLAFCNDSHELPHPADLALNAAQYALPESMIHLRHTRVGMPDSALIVRRCHCRGEALARRQDAVTGFCRMPSINWLGLVFAVMAPLRDHRAAELVAVHDSTDVAISDDATGLPDVAELALNAAPYALPGRYTHW